MIGGLVRLEDKTRNKVSQRETPLLEGISEMEKDREISCQRRDFQVDWTHG